MCIPGIFRNEKRAPYFLKLELQMWGSNLAWGIGPPKLAQAPGTGPDPTARSPTNRPSYTAVKKCREGLGQSHACSLGVGPKSLNSHELRSPVSVAFPHHDPAVLAYSIPPPSPLQD